MHTKGLLDRVNVFSPPPLLSSIKHLLSALHTRHGFHVLPPVCHFFPLRKKMSKKICADCKLLFNFIFYLWAFFLFYFFYLFIFFLHCLKVGLEISLHESGVVSARSQHVVCGFLDPFQVGPFYPLQLNDLLTEWQNLCSQHHHIRTNRTWIYCLNFDIQNTFWYSPLYTLINPFTTKCNILPQFLYSGVLKNIFKPWFKKCVPLSRFCLLSPPYHNVLHLLHQFYCVILCKVPVKKKKKNVKWCKIFKRQ